MTTAEGHERCIPLEKFQNLQELHDNQKKIIARLQQENQELRETIAEYKRPKSDLDE